MKKNNLATIIATVITLCLIVSWSMIMVKACHQVEQKGLKSIVMKFWEGENK